MLFIHTKGDRKLTTQGALVVTKSSHPDFFNEIGEVFGEAISNKAFLMIYLIQNLFEIISLGEFHFEFPVWDHDLFIAWILDYLMKLDVTQFHCTDVCITQQLK
jgi:hypothetical protein